MRGFYWYNAGGSSEGIGTGWFYSVQGGGDRPLLAEPQRTEVSFDNTHEGVVRGDYPISTVFNGSFDVGLSDDPDAPVPGWSFHNGGVASSDNPQPPDIVEANSSNPPPPNSPVPLPNDKFGANLITIGDLEEVYTDLKTTKDNNNHVMILNKDGATAIHNQQLIPEWGNLRFEVFAPNREGTLTLTLEIPGEGIIGQPQIINLAEKADGIITTDSTRNTVHKAYVDNINKIGFGENGFETFQFPFQKVDNYEDLKGKPIRIKFELTGTSGEQPVYIDNVFFQSEHLELSNPTNARWDLNTYTQNLLVEKPGYVVSYNTETQAPNWVSYQLNESWISEPPPARQPRRAATNFTSDVFLPSTLPQADSSKLSGSGFDQGHLVADNHRNRNVKDQLETYMGTNLIPQAADNNEYFSNVQPELGLLRGSHWYNIERQHKKDAYEGKNVYIYAGAFGNHEKSEPQSRVIPERSPYNTKPEQLQNQGIQVPKWTWKIALVTDSVNSTIATNTTAAYAYITPNMAEPFKPDEWPADGIVHPFNLDPFNSSEQSLLEILREKFPDRREFTTIKTPADWRNPETWGLSILELQTILNTQTNLEFNFLSNLDDNLENEFLNELPF